LPGLSHAARLPEISNGSAGCKPDFPSLICKKTSSGV
jgi:hypothetical protein